MAVDDERPLESRGPAWRGRRLTSLALLASLSACALPAVGDWYLGARLGSVRVDPGQSGDPLNLAVLAGYAQPAGGGDLALEAEIGASIDDGGISGEPLKVSTRGLYAAYRSGGLIYFKARAGVSENEVRPRGLVSDRARAAVGIGAGLGIELMQLELEYTRFEGELAFFSLAIQF